MTTPRRRHVDIPDTSRYSRRDFLAGTGATGAAIIAPAFVPLKVRAAPDPATDFKPLPAPTREGGMPLMQALAQRRSTREFSTRKIPEQVLSDLLWAAYGVNRASGDRTAPCWRHIVAIDVYAAMEDGLWLYDPKRHALVPHPAGDIRAQTGQQEFAGRAPLNLVYVANGQRMSELTPENRKLYCSVDAAFIGQNVYLYCASVGLATVFRGAVDYPRLARAMRLDHEQFVAFAQTVGYPREA
ncbi:MAG: SagB/ThcOx family dehydrogenase [Betaproteobacteria bacterium]|nr:SagB/ThcOx family dehydrogenase [Betaproteobacteria bacterium]